MNKKTGVEVKHMRQQIADSIKNAKEKQFHEKQSARNEKYIET